VNEMLDLIKISLRISPANKAFDDEIKELIESARHELMLSGISPEKANAQEKVDPLVRRAITTYAKANFGFDNPDSEKLRQSFESLKNHMSLSGDYNVLP
jgi:uncharacterized phage protein (predicted DNA packaging)